MQFSRFGLKDEEQIEGDIIYQIRKWKNTKGRIMDLTRAYSAEEVCYSACTWSPESKSRK